MYMPTGIKSIYPQKTWSRMVISPVQFSSVAQSCPTLCNPMDCSMPGFPVHHQLPESTQIHAHHIGDAIQPSHPLSSPFPPTFNLSLHQGLFQWVSSSHQVAKVLGVSASASVLPMNIQDLFPQVPQKMQKIHAISKLSEYLSNKWGNWVSI